MGTVRASNQARLGMKSLALLLLGFGLCNGWGYEGPNYWPVIYPKCDGILQSPIDIDNDQAQDNYFFSDGQTTYMQFKDHEVSQPGTWYHTGYTIEWKATGALANRPALVGGILQSVAFPASPVYTLDSLHLTWGSDNCRGSEHTIDGVAYPAEIQFVYFNYQDYADVEAAKGKYNGILIISQLLQVGGENNTGMEFIFDAADVLQNSSLTFDESIIIDQNFFQFNPGQANGDVPKNNARAYYYYEGSLTTPNCEEVVQWMVWEQVHEISQYQLDRLRMLQYPDGTQLVDNFRPVQPHNNRIVHRVWQ